MKKYTGFTLIELMIVVTIAAILAAVSYPAYQSYVRKGHRSEAQQLMLNVANKQEQYMLNARSYTDDFTNLGITSDAFNCTATTCSNNFYDVTISTSTGSPPSFTVTATAKGPQSEDGDLTLNSAGSKTHDGSAGW